ncbi:phosphate transporter [Fusarium pseudoanthophilum]|uniref:Phosphate transporter n=1 Tax=Fusarium pseudoanthophilum TaxID=48495 RepID=A0A8H5PP92_9HYPO|nr:phosphate transporter [Fusarium pseudoanthophilum]
MVSHGDSLVVTDPTTNPPCARADASSTNLIIILGMMQVSKRVPFDDPFVLNAVRAVYLASSVLPHLEEFILVMHEGYATLDLHKIHQIANTKRP